MPFTRDTRSVFTDAPAVARINPLTRIPALILEDGEVITDSTAILDHLDEIARSVEPGAHALLILDVAGWHGSAALVVPDNLSLLTLPPYAPELNPVENVWA